MTVKQLIVELLKQPMSAPVVLQVGNDPIANLELQRVHIQLVQRGRQVRLSYERE